MKNIKRGCDQNSFDGKTLARLFLLIIMLGLYSLTLSAESITEDEAKDKARQFLLEKSGVSRRGGRVAPVGAASQLRTAEAKDAFFVFNVDSAGGFVVVSGDDRMPAVLGYSYSGTYKSDDIPDNMRAWLEGYAEQYEYLQTHSDAEAVSLTSVSGGKISPLLSCHWGQGSPYNDKCPKIDGQSTLTGCVATAMAQIMYYHQWPKQTSKTILGYNTSSNKISIPDIGVTSIDWDNIVPFYDRYETYRQNDAVATLMYLCGASVKMYYGLDWSGASTRDAADAFGEYFDYDPINISRVYRSSYTSDVWNQLIYDELKAKRPVLYSGFKDGDIFVGHAFVVDGYDDNDYFHVNWGWESSYDNYFLLSALLNYNSLQDAIIGIEPRYLPATSITINLSEAQMAIDERLDLTIELSPSDANPRVIWKSSNPEIASVNDSGVVTGVAAGTSTITATTTDGTNLSASCLVTVEPYVLKGQCGTSLSYVLDDKYVLTITGTGMMYSFTSSNQPWKTYADKIVSISLPEGITSIGSYAFYDCSAVESVDIPQNVTYIDDYAFIMCTSLESVTCMARTVPTIASGAAFFGVPLSHATLSVPYSALNAYKSATTWKSFGAIEPIFLPATSITMNLSEAQMAIDERVDLTVELSPSDANPRVIWKSSDPEVAAVDDSGVVRGVAAGTSTITATTTDGTDLSATCQVTVEPYFLKGKCGTNLSYVLDDKYVLTITGTGSMNSYTSSNQPWKKYADKIVSVCLPEGITSIGSYAFSGCSAVESVEIPENVTYIGSYAFQNCSAIETFTCTANRIPNMGNNVFSGMNQSDATLIVKDELLGTYKSSSQWKEFGTIIAFEDLPSPLQYYTYDGEESVLSNKSDWEELLANTPNAIAYADSEHKNWATRHRNVLVKNTDNSYKCADFLLTDLSQGYSSSASEAIKTGFYTPVSFTATKGEYKRQAYAGYNTLCLPFSFKASELSSSAKVFTFDSYDEDKSKVVFKAVSGTIEAGWPCIVKEKTEVEWTVNLAGKTIDANLPNEDSYMRGTYVTTDMYQGKGYGPRSTDNKFAPLTQYLHPFRACLLLGEQNDADARGSISVVFMDEDGATVIDKINASVNVADVPKAIYTLSGQRVNEVKRSGLYIVNGKKQYIEVK